MYTDQMPTPREVLIAYSKQQANTEQVMRALTEHSDWYIPAGYAMSRLHTTTSDSAIIFAPEVPTSDRALILFTDSEAAARADGAPIGVFARSFSGVQIFQALDDRYGCVRVNPHSPQSEGWYLSQEAFPLAKLWAQVVHLEQALAKSTGESVPYGEIASHPGFMVLINAERLPITLTLKQPAGTYAVAFTAPDCLQAFVGRQPAEHQPNMKSATLDGVTLCQQLQRFEVAGVAIYYGNGRGMVLRKDEFASVISPA
jgi:hypothetical protein